MKVVVFVLLAAGLYLLLTAIWPGVYRPAEVALRKRAPKSLTQSDVLIQSLAKRIAPRIDIEPVKRIRLDEMLRSLGKNESPELFLATALTKALIISLAMTWLVILSPVVGIVIVVGAFTALYSSQPKKLEKEMTAKRNQIERELPQFASTIRQSLNSTHDIVTILETYKKVCGPTLRSEIDRTLNDLVTGSPERALKALESRVASPKLGQVVRGLVATLRGDDQRIYFDMLAAEFRKAQDEEVAKQLQKRPEELNPYMGMLFGGMAMMIAAALGTFIMQQITLYFT